MTVRRALVPAMATTGASFVTLATAVLAVRAGPTAHAAATPVTASATLTAVVVLLIAGVVGCIIPRVSIAGALCAASVVAWLAPVWVGWHAGPSILRVAAAGVALLLTPLLLHLLLVPASGLLTRARRSVIACAYALTVGVALGIALTRDPFRDTECWSDCNIVGAPLASQSAATIFLIAATLLPVIAGGGALVWWAGTVRDAPDREWSVAVTGTAAIALAATSADQCLRFLGVVESASVIGFSASHLASAAALTLVGAGVVWAAGRAMRRRRAVRRLSESLSAAPAPGTLESALRTAIGDPGLRVAYWLPHTERFVDAAGRPVTPGPEAITVLRDGDVLARITLDRPTADAPALVEGIGAATRLTIDNERLLAESAAQLVDIMSSRSRIADAADRTRHGIERDLHDGAQAGLIAALFELSAAGGDDPRIGALTERGRAIAADLRELTHGVYPSALDDFGLEDALRTLLDGTRPPTSLEFSLVTRPHPAVERAIYAVVRRLISVATPSVVSVEAEGSRIRVTLAGLSGDVELSYAEDRVGAAGGTLIRRGDAVVASLPAESINRSAAVGTS